MKVSIITTSLNSAATIESTLLSVVDQTYSHIEYIIVDGGSTDRTLPIVEKYKNRISIIISEKDNGIYDAMNKGITHATGDIIGILNSDDVYANEKIIEIVVKEINDKNLDCVWGDLLYVDKNNINKVIRYWKSSEYKKNKFQRGWHPPHPTFFVKNEIYKKFGIFRNDLSIAADYELMLRFLAKNKIISGYIPKVLVRMRAGGVSNKNLKNVIKANMECLKAFELNNLSVNPLIFFLKPFLKLFQLFR